MRRILLAVTAVSALAIGGIVQAGGPARYAGWDHHHHDDYCYRPQVRYYAPPVYYPQVYPVPVQTAVPYYYHPGNNVSFYGRNFGIRVGF
ncbi:MAG TPA: hypothetical protein VGI75_01960 [Pirellulales bacterium]|jgi:hypothetical protein